MLQAIEALIPDAIGRQVVHQLSGIHVFKSPGHAILRLLNVEVTTKFYLDPCQLNTTLPLFESKSSFLNQTVDLLLCPLIGILHLRERTTLG